MKTTPNKVLRRLLPVILAASLLASATLTVSCFKNPFQKSDAGVSVLKDIDFKLFEDNVTSDLVSLHFSVKDPKALGLSIPEATLGDVSKQKSDETFAKFETYLEQLAKVDSKNLSKKDQVLYDVIEYDLKEALDYQDYYYYSSPFNSITGLQTNLPLVLSEYAFENKEDIDQYLLLLKDMKRYYGDLMDFEKERADKGFGASDVNLQKIIDSCDSFLADRENHFLISSFAGRLDKVSGLTDTEISDYIEQNQKMLDDYVFPAYQSLIDGFNGLMGKGENEGGLCNLKNGKKYYALLLKSDTSSDSSVKTITNQIEKALSDEMDIIMAAPTDSSFQDSYNTYNFSEGTVKQNLDYCESAIKDDFPEIMKHNVTLQEVPAALEDFFSPAAYLSCRIDDPTDNLIVTNTAALTDYQNLLEMVAHEGYPGHLYESVYHAQNISSYYQRTASFLGFSEGWAEYAAEYILKNSDYDQELVSYIAAENQVTNLLLPSRIDVGVNYEGWNLQDVIKYVADYNLSEDYASYCYDMVIEIPCYYMPYCIGHINTDNIITNAQKKLGNSFSLQDIHKAYLDIGPSPFQIVEKYMDNYIQSQ